jgi:acyl-CoA synthetase (AMP-forming)/AMP-acid ligase II
MMPLNADSEEPSMPTIVELIEDAAVGAGRVRFCSAAVDSDVTTAELWHASERAAAWLRTFAGTAEPVALVLTASLPCLATLIGGWRGGHLVASLPLPARGMDATEYRQQVASQLATVAARVVVCDPRHYPLLEGIADEVRVFDEYDSTAPTRPLTGDGTFVQFTSGATGAPKGVRLSLHAIGNNVTAIADALEVSPGDVWCSWLPLSHDMGLMGACLTSIVSSAPRIAGSQGLVQLQPETFLADPSAWLATCADVQAAVTIVPSFALALAIRVSSRFSGRNLRSLRV